jgi:hypothetical protein
LPESCGKKTRLPWAASFRSKFLIPGFAEKQKSLGRFAVSYFTTFRAFTVFRVFRTFIAFTAARSAIGALGSTAFFAVCSVLINDFFWMDMAELPLVQSWIPASPG